MAQARHWWLFTLRKHGIDEDEAEPIWEELAALYSEPNRYYHTMTHINKMCAALELYQQKPPIELCFAIFYHDAIYDTTKNDNEEASAELAVARMEKLGIEPSTRAITRDLILCTKSHHTPEGECSELSGLFLDLDLLILGAAANEYENYSARIRKEWFWVPEDQYKLGRSKVLESFLTRPFIYFTDAIRSNFEHTARENIKNELKALKMSV
jgi:predicted metal-dependent HD superfamily phosphohydrolase